ncbi:NlpC/P60 family protein [Nocardia sp. NPDC050710]|uniref:C40 family peptidase n=1 Tax=Nocardia sp. NPDC050710 TaxID=3157220 RepID=UPI0033DE92AE
MAPALTGALDGVLQSLLGLYGAGQPNSNQSGSLTQSTVAELRGQIGTGYTGAHDGRAKVVESHTAKEGTVGTAVTASSDGTVIGRNKINGHIADLQARLQALTAIGDSRFAGPAMLNAAQTSLANATKQVNTDIAATRERAAQIMPPTTPQPVRGTLRSNPRRRPRRRIGSGGRSGRSGRGPLRSDRTAGGRAVNAASAWLGAPYIWGGGGAGGPSGGGFDCSGLTQYAIAQATNGEVVLPRTTYDQIHSGIRVHPNDVQPGDLVFPASSFSSPGVPEHVQLAVGNGMVIEAPYSGSHVKYSPMTSNAVVVRVL